MNKQSNERFNELIEYIENNLCEEINYKRLSQILDVNEYTMHRIFLFVTFWKENLNKIKGKSEYGFLEYDKTCSIDEATYYIASKILNFFNF